MNNKILKLNLLAAAGIVPAVAGAQDKPNVVFLMAEDLAMESFALYNGEAAVTPNLDRMAQHGIVFNNAYSCAAVSSAARSSLITGCYAPSLGLSWHRKLEQVTLPEGMHLFPYYLREAGYYTCNASKTDYNCVMEKGAWNQVKGEIGDWRNRKDPSQPFFHCLTITSCHESSLQFPEDDIDNKPTEFNPADVHIMPMHPDTKTFRYTYARHYDAIKGVDDVLGKLLDMLREDGILDNTFVFYFGDNGGCLPGTKAYTHDLGLHVPMVVYVPDKYKDLSPLKKGSRTNAVVSFIDLAPTLLNLAGVKIPEYMDGRPFLGKGVGTGELDEMDMTICYGDRYDELYACNRVVRKQDYTYSRNFYPYHPESVCAYYRLRQPAFREWYQLHEEGKLNAVQDAFFQPQGPERLYLLSQDRYQTNDLSASKDYIQILNLMRSLLDRKMTEEIDLGIIPEALWLGRVGDIEAYKTSIKDMYPEYLAAANLARRPYSETAKELKAALKSSDEIIQFWALVSCNTYGTEAMSMKKFITKLMKKGTPIIRSKAAVYMTRFCGYDPSALFNKSIDESRNQGEILSILNDAAVLKTLDPEISLNIESRESLEDTYGKQRLKFIND